LTRDHPHFPGQLGVPGTDNARGLRLDANGRVLWVDPNYPGVSDARDGTNPENPLRTVTAALTKCRAYSGDVIAVAPSAYWTYSNLALGRATPIAEEVVVTVPGVRIVGLYPSGALGVPWSVTQDGGIAIDVQAMDVLIEGFQFYDSVHTAPIAIRAQWGGPSVLYGENLTVRNCFFYGFPYGFAYGIQLDWTYNCHIHDNIFQLVATAAIHNLNAIGNPDFIVVEDNFFIACGIGVNLLDSSSCTIRRNEFMRCTNAIKMAGGNNNTILSNAVNGDGAGAANFIDLTGGANNLVADNWLGCTLAQYTGPGGTCDDATSGAWVNNHCINGDTVSAP
jgi:parallel beta-helix repeat protein